MEEIGTATSDVFPSKHLHQHQPVPNVCHNRPLCTATAYRCGERVQDWRGYIEINVRVRVGRKCEVCRNMTNFVNDI